jgi:hypothetical protein
MRASPEEEARTLAWLLHRERTAHPRVPEAELRRRAELQLRELQKRDPALLRALRDYAPSSAAPRGQININVELAAALSLPPVQALLRNMALTPSQRGPVTDLSGSVATLVYSAAIGGSAFATRVFDSLAGHTALQWAFRYPVLAAREKQRYKNLKTVTGRPGQARGHDPSPILAANIALIRQLAAARDGDQPRHPRLGLTCNVDATALRAPVDQTVSKAELDAIRRPGMERVCHIVKRHDDRGPADAGRADDSAADGLSRATVVGVGWKPIAIQDQATMLPLIWQLGSGSASEVTLLRELLPRLYELWPECPIETLVGDKAYGFQIICRELEQNFGIHPIFPLRRGHADPVVKTSAGISVKTVDGIPHCHCGAMKPRHQSFESRERRLKAGLLPGERDSSYYDARTRWTCARRLCGEVSTYAHNEPHLYTYWPHQGASRFAYDRAAQYEYRNGVESLFATLKNNGLGTYNMRPLWARDSEAEFLLGLHMLFVTASRVVHETGIYDRFLDEYQQLGLDRGNQPDRSAIELLHAERPSELQWTWPQPGRADNTLLRDTIAA